jgi:large subunit ribosomal protein L16
MLQPKRVKYRRPHGLKYDRGPTKATNVDFGEYGLQATQGDYVTDHQIEAARIVLARYTDRAGKIWIRIFPHMAKTKKPAEVRMGSGKGNPEGWVAVVKKAPCSSKSAASPTISASKPSIRRASSFRSAHKVMKRTKALSEAEKLKMEAQHESSLTRSRPRMPSERPFPIPATRRRPRVQPLLKALPLLRLPPLRPRGSR